MSGTDSPDLGSGADTALSFEDGVAAIEGFLSRVPDALEEDDQDSAAIGESQTEEGQDADVSAESSDENAEEDEGLELEVDDAEAGTDAPDEPKFKAGQFASRDAKVKLDDGTTISVTDLIAGNMFQSKFTEKTMALAEERKSFDRDRGEFAETKQQIEHQRNVILTLAQKLMPKEPTPVDPNEDPAGYLSYLAEREAFANTMGELDNLWKAQQADRVKETEKQKKEREEGEAKAVENYKNWVVAEQEKFFSAVPKLKDEASFQKWKGEVSDIGKKVYNFTDQELSNFYDHRFLRMLSDAAKWQTAIAKRDAGAKPPAAQPQQPRIPQKQRMAPQASQNRDFASAADRLRKTGSLQDAAKALEKFV